MGVGTQSHSRRFGKGTSEQQQGPLSRVGAVPFPNFSQGYADEEDYPPWTWDPTSGEDLAKGTTAAAVPAHALPWGTAGSTGAPSPTTRCLPSTGEGHGRGGEGPSINLCAPPCRASRKILLNELAWVSETPDRFSSAPETLRTFPSWTQQ